MSGMRHALRRRRRAGLLAAAALGSSLGLAGCASAAPARPATPAPPLASSAVQPAASAPAPAPRLPILAPNAELAQAALAARFGDYPTRDARWVAGWALAVNRDFNMALAMAIESAGSGLAASKRRADNEALAQRLSQEPPLDVAAMLRARCERQGCAALAGQRVRIYGLLFGEQRARISVVLERLDAAPGTPPHAAVSEAAALQSFEDPHTLAASFETQLGSILELLESKTAPTAAASSSTAQYQCTLGDGATLPGEVIERSDTRGVLSTAEPVPMLLACPSSALTAQPVPPSEPPED